MNKFIISEAERKHIGSLHNLSLVLEEEESKTTTEKIYTDHDKVWDYKVVDGKWYTRRKTNKDGKWVDISSNEKYKSSLDKLNTKYPTAVADESAGSTETNCADNKTPFATKEDGNTFRLWVNTTYPDYAKEIDLDKEGSHTNAYIMKAHKKYCKEYTDSKIKKDEKKDDVVKCPGAEADPPTHKIVDGICVEITEDSKDDKKKCPKGQVWNKKTQKCEDEDKSISAVKGEEDTPSYNQEMQKRYPKNPLAKYSGYFKNLKII